jgi:hypothetical protein
LKNSLGIIICLAFILSGCTSIVISDKSSEIVAKKFETKSNLANVYIYTKLGDFESVHTSKLNIDGTFIGNFYKDSFVKVALPPGKHVFKSSSTFVSFMEVDENLEIVLDSEKNYFLEKSVKKLTRGLVWTHYLFRQSEETGKSEISERTMVAIPESTLKTLSGQPASNLPIKISNPEKPPTERLVLMPFRLVNESANLSSSMETALVQGLKLHYIVFAGDPVATRARQIFQTESRNEKKTDCDETICLQRIAEAFQSELVASANVTKQDGGYFISLIIRNVFDNKVVFSNSVACENCSSFQVVEKIKELGSQ